MAEMLSCPCVCTVCIVYCVDLQSTKGNVLLKGQCPPRGHTEEGGIVSHGGSYQIFRSEMRTYPQKSPC